MCQHFQSELWPERFFFVSWIPNRQNWSPTDKMAPISQAPGTYVSAPSAHKLFWPYPEWYSPEPPQDRQNPLFGVFATCCPIFWNGDYASTGSSEQKNMHSRPVLSPKSENKLYNKYFIYWSMPQPKHHSTGHTVRDATAEPAHLISHISYPRAWVQSTGNWNTNVKTVK